MISRTPEGKYIVTHPIFFIFKHNTEPFDTLVEAREYFNESAHKHSRAYYESEALRISKILQTNPIASYNHHGIERVEGQLFVPLPIQGFEFMTDSEIIQWFDGGHRLERIELLKNEQRQLVVRALTLEEQWAKSVEDTVAVLTSSFPGSFYHNDSHIYCRDADESIQIVKPHSLSPESILLRTNTILTNCTKLRLSVNDS